MTQLTFDEKLEIASRMRENERFAPVTNEEFMTYSISEKLLEVETSLGKSKTFYIAPDNNPEKVRPLLINFHGGGFIKGRLDRDKLFCYKLVEALDCIILDVDYKLAPEYPYPTALNESYEIVQWAFENSDQLKIDENRIGLSGHSAGGNLAAGSMTMAGEKKGRIARCLAIEYPPLDLLTNPEDKIRKERDLSPDRAKLYNSFYCVPEETKEYQVSPLYTPIEKLGVFPKTLIISAGEDSLAEEAEEFGLQLVKAGVEVTLKRFVNSVHGFTINRMDEHEEALELFVEFLKRTL